MVFLSAFCTGCAMQGAMFHTLISVPGNTYVVRMCVQVAFIVAGCTHEVYYKILKNALGIDAFIEPVFMDTIYSMYLIVKSITDDMGFYACSKYVDRMPVITCLFTVCLLIDTLCRFSHF